MRHKAACYFWSAWGWGGRVAEAGRAWGVRVCVLVAGEWLFAVTLAAGALLRLLAMLGYPGALWFAGDSSIYLGAALRLRPVASRVSGYSLFLRALEPFHSLTLVTGVQHLMGLGVAVMVYALARRAGVPRGWATAATLPVLLDGFEIEAEHMVMPEALFTFLIMCAMALILWRGRVRWPAALLAGVLAGCAVDVRTAGLPMLVLFPAAALLRGLRQDGSWRWRNWRGWLAAGVMAAGCAMPVVAYAGWFHSWTGSYALTRADGLFLWGRASSFAQCPVIRPPTSELKVCPPGPPSKRPPPGDYIWSAPQVNSLPGGPLTAANDALLRDFALHAVAAQPLGYLHAVLNGLALSVEWSRRPYPDAATASYYYFHIQPQVLPALTLIPGGTAYSDAIQYGHATPSRVAEPYAGLIARYQRVFYTSGPLFGLIMLTGLGSLVRIRLRPPRLTWHPASSTLPWATAVTLLIFPIATADFDYRYLLPVLPFACLAAVQAIKPPHIPSAQDTGEAGHPSRQCLAAER